MKKTITLLLLFLCIFGFDSLGADVIVNGQRVGDAVMIGESAYVPLRSVSETMGASVTWDENSQTAYVNSTDEIIPKIVEKVSPSVVGIIGKIKKDDVEGIGYGSGFVIGEDGSIMTNAHVVSGMQRILVVMNGGKAYEGKVKYIDKDGDMAVVKVEAAGLTPLKLADISTVAPGQTVVAIGTPVSFSLRNTATVGIISGLNRSRSNAYRLLQSDAALNPGNSGGPLLNLKGEVVGMGTLGISGTTGLYFSVTCETIRFALEQFEKNGRIIRPTLGAELKEGWLAEYDLPSDEGLSITKVFKDSPAEKNGLVPGDAILGIADTYVSTITDYNEVMKHYAPGDRVPFKVKKGNSVVTVNIIMK